MKFAGLVALFLLFLYPVGVGEFSVNYAFVLYPLAVAVSGQRFLRPPDFVVLGLLLFSLIFTIAVFTTFDAAGAPLHRPASYLVFLAIFAFSIVRITPEMVAAFKRAVIIISVYFSSVAISKFVGLAALGPIHFEVKTALGSQRFGFIYIVAFWLAALDPVTTLRRKIFNYASLAVITAGLFLTFSRSSVVAVAGSVLLFTLMRLAYAVWRPTLSRWLTIGLGVLAIGVAAALTFYVFPLTLEFYSYTLLGPLMDASLFQALGQSESSEGIRVVRIAESIEYVLRYPLTGTGYLGIWAFSQSHAGSSHNQLLDTFIRVGFLGFAFYLLLLSRVTLFLARHDRALFWGMVGVLIYGLFHETFKESQGGFVLAFLIGMASEHWRSRRALPARHAAPAPIRSTA